MHRTLRRLALAFSCVLLGSISHAQTDDAALHRLAGSMILTGFSGNDPFDPGFIRVRDQLQQGHIAGVLFFKPNLTGSAGTVATAAAMAGVLRQASGAGKPPPLLAVDEEGGRVQRLRDPRIASARVLAGMDSAEQRAVFAGLAQSVAAAGLTLNLAPVVDLHDQRSPAIGALGRSFSADPDRVAILAAAMVEAHRAQGVATALKHFPGHGLARADSHAGFVDITDTWQPAELEPFLALIRAGQADMIMTAHVFHADFDRLHPATLSRAVVTDLLRGMLGFDGVVVSDDLTMRAIDESYSLEDAVLLAVDAGVDLLLTGNFQPDAVDQAEQMRIILVEAVQSGRLSRQRLQESHDRILALRQRLR